MTETSFGLFPQHIKRVKQLVDQRIVQHGFEALIVHSGAPLYRFLDDLEYPFKVNPQFSWWVPEQFPSSLVAYRPGAKPRLFFYQPIDYWHLQPSDPDPDWADEFELVPMRKAEEWREQLTDSPRVAVIGNAPKLAEHFSQAALNPAALIHELDLDRTVKTPYELDCLARANRRAVRGHLAAAAAFAAGASEFETHLAYLRATAHNDSELPYGNIIAQNQHGGVLHYHGLERAAPEPQRSFLIDAGAQWQSYAADITRTYCAEKGGVFEALINGMEALELALVDGARAGVDYRDLHIEAHHRIAGLLQQADIVRMAPEAMVESGVSNAFFPHGLGHYLGLQVHDVGGLLSDTVGERIPRPEGHPYLRLTRRLAAGNVLTIEPGLYFIPQLLGPLRAGAHSQAVNWTLVESLLPFGGIRIEDDVVVQQNGAPRNLSREAFAAAA